MRGIALMAFVSLTGCVVWQGQHVDNLEATYRPSGAPTRVFAPRRAVDGELLELRDTAFVILTPDQVVLVPFRFADSVHAVDRARPFKVSGDLTPEDRERLRLISRYPPGMPQVALARLLSVRNQLTLAVVGR